MVLNCKGTANPMKPEYFKSALQGEDIPHREYLDVAMPEDQVLPELIFPWSIPTSSSIIGPEVYFDTGHTRRRVITEIRIPVYPISESVKHISSLIGMLQLFLFAMVFFGESICGFIGIPTPDLVKSMQDNKFTSFFAVYFIGSTLQGILMNTGAFEIYKGNTLIWSTLQAGRLPKLNDIVMVS
ncbi:hypothetical protein FOL47_000536 [Perkinsus chesapeaki]|uniref:Uncharacterized protein n=1 Tax=Perkinsus chesapeaki TaxID=330153 RepID=A0A7J6N3R2_PERCH|nr:hypothetical protein FOL47_000536 [Perkinsus chesapeaki]